MIFDLSNRVTGKAKALLATDPAVFEEQQAAAEAALKLTAVNLTDAALILRLSRGIVQQINWQLELGLEPFYMLQVNSSQSKQNRTYRPDVSLVSPLALLTIDGAWMSVGRQEFSDLRSIR